MNIDTTKATVQDLKEYINKLEKEIHEQKKYGLVWDRKNTPENAILKCTENIPILINDDSKTIKSASGKTNENILIEGDNFYSLSCLNYIFNDTIDIIYIDPPYNTGIRDFIYNDSFVDSEDGYRHSKWLSFIYSRLKLCRPLLKANGLLFISIDYREFAQLKLLCDQIFGEAHFIGCFNWMKTATAPNLSKTIRNKMEYILCYSKGNVDFTLNGGLTSGGDIPLLNNGNKNAHCFFPKESVEFRIPDGVYKAGQYDRVFLDADIEIRNGKSLTDLELYGPFKWKQETILDEVKQGTTFIIKSSKFAIRFKRKEKSVKTPSNLITKDECGVGTNEEGYGILKDIFGYCPFDNPKPVSLIKYLINFNPSKSAVVLDFFAGSGTTGQAVLELNADDGGTRHFILCTNNENNICTDVCYPRLKTVITGIKGDGSKFSDGISSNLRYFKTDFVKDQANRDSAKYSLVAKCNGLICILEDCYDLVEQEYEWFHYTSKCKDMFIYNDFCNDAIFNAMKDKILACEKPVVLYVFSTDENLDGFDFSDLENVTIKPIPSKIYEIYKEIVEEIQRG